MHMRFKTRDVDCARNCYSSIDAHFWGASIIALRLDGQASAAMTLINISGFQSIYPKKLNACKIVHF